MKIFIIIAIVSFSLFLTEVESKRGRKKYRRVPLGTYICPANEVLNIYDVEPEYAVHTFCSTPPVCKQQLICTPSQGDCVQPGLSFLAGVVESNKYDPLDKTCCTYPEPEEYDATECYDVQVTDKPRSQSRRRRPKLNKAVAKLLNIRTKRDIGTRFGLAQVYRNPLDGDEVTKLIVTDISRIPDGYNVKACVIRCSESEEKSEEEEEEPEEEKKPDYIEEEPEEPEDVPDRKPRPEKPKPKPEAKPEKGIDLGEFKAKVPGSASGAGGALACFAGDSMVDTLTGPKRMDQLLSDDKVLVSSIENGGAIYQPVDTWYHRIADKQSEFVTIKTAHTQLSLSPAHLLPLVDCDQAQSMSSDQLIQLVNHKSMFASRATVGQCVIVHQNGEFVAAAIEGVERETKEGIYSPITPQGTLVVNGVHVSCFTTLENHWAQHTLHGFVMEMYGMFERFTGVKAGQMTEFMDIPIPMKIAMSLANLVLPESMF